MSTRRRTWRSFTSFLQAGGYAGFDNLYGPARTKPGPITEVVCWAHKRRGFFDEWEQHKSPTANQALLRIAAIYPVDAHAAFAPLAERVELRRQPAPLVDEFFTWAEAMAAKLTVKSSLAGAFLYAKSPGNAVEIPCRRPVGSRQQHRRKRHARPRASLVQTAKLNHVTPEAYLGHLFAKIPNGHTINRINELMPWQNFVGSL